jgi:iron complex transport system ATP-binding protein
VEDPLTRTSEGTRQPSELLLELNDASVVLGDARVLDSLTLTIALGEHTAILGPNGAGKSTLVKLLTLQLYPAVNRDGRGPLTSDGVDGIAPIRVFGQDRWDVFELRSQLGIVSADLHDRFVHGNSNGIITALDAVVSGFFATHGVFGHQRVTETMRERARQALEWVGGGDLVGATLDRLSTGEARRVLIARALVHQPRALVLDEPTRGLDLVARYHFMERVRAIARAGTTILLVTHYVDEIIPEIDRVVLLKHGRIARDGRKSDVLTGPALGEAFDAPLAVDAVGGYYHIRVAGTAAAPR